MRAAIVRERPLWGRDGFVVLTIVRFGHATDVRPSGSASRSPAGSPYPARVGSALLIAAPPALGKAAAAAFGDRLHRRPAADLDDLPDDVAVVVVCRDHPDRFRGIAATLRRRWPLAELHVVDGPWSASAHHTRSGVPPILRSDQTAAIERLHAIAGGDSPQAWPMTLTRTDAILAKAGKPF